MCAIYDPATGRDVLNALKQSLGHASDAGGPFPGNPQGILHPLINGDFFGPYSGYGGYTAFAPIVIYLPPGQYELLMLAESRIDCRSQRAAVYEFTTSLTGDTVFSVGSHLPCGEPWVQDTNRTATATTGLFCKPSGVDKLTVTIQNYRVYTCCDNSLEYYETVPGFEAESMWRLKFSAGECPCNPLP